MRYIGDAGADLDVPAAEPAPPEPAPPADEPPPPPAPAPAPADLAAVLFDPSAGGAINPATGAPYVDTIPTVTEPTPPPVMPPPVAPPPAPAPPTPLATIPPEDVAAALFDPNFGGATNPSTGLPYDTTGLYAEPAPGGTVVNGTRQPLIGDASDAAGAAQKPAEAWRALLKFFWQRIPQVSGRLDDLRRGLPRVVD